ncbi:hypothetical protein EVAR_17518_1 [Eumeta japonica]|uniref:Uncharacterized protein n=1 Tax=Eumeta variegata TaxID=151549 RepID=A0A4C1WR34_EUMVA|nr:hypothetical protein EVAR_17518_1 [Eumeta japonica]
MHPHQPPVGRGRHSALMIQCRRKYGMSHLYLQTFRTDINNQSLFKELDTDNPSFCVSIKLFACSSTPTTVRRLIPQQKYKFSLVNVEQPIFCFTVSASDTLPPGRHVSFRRAVTTESSPYTFSIVIWWQMYKITDSVFHYTEAKSKITARRAEGGRVRAPAHGAHANESKFMQMVESSAMNHWPSPRRTPLIVPRLRARAARDPYATLRSC